MRYQEAGHVIGFTAKSRSEAASLIAAARRATPDNLRCQFRSYIRADKEGYLWGWVLK